ncbi:MAG: substrate-binding domain-containing protein, partial [Propionibacteriaceae bacterium]|nr:substrate-binding domain-containing protein [Propionibacteriaceae bacterium]
MSVRGARLLACGVAVALGVTGIAPVQATPVIPAASYPTIDGAAAARPLALAFQKAFTDATASGVFHGADEAYARLAKGTVDLVVATAPTKAQVDAAAAAGHQLDVIPVASEPLQFLTSTDNPVSSLTADQIRDIYAGVVTDWAAVGGVAGPITAYQHPTDSVSQVAMADLVMRG